MNNKELQEALRHYPDNAPVFISIQTKDGVTNVYSIEEIKAPENMLSKIKYIELCGNVDD